MADILYTYKNQVYANITNRCDCSCTFCIRSHGDGVGEAENLWFQKEPTLQEIKEAMDAFKNRRKKEGAGVSKKDVANYMRKQKKEAEEPVNNAFAEAFAKLGL